MVCLSCCSRAGYIVDLHLCVLTPWCIFHPSVCVAPRPILGLHREACFFIREKPCPGNAPVLPKLTRNATNAFCVYLTIVVFLLFFRVSRPHAGTFGAWLTKLIPMTISYSQARTTHNVCDQMTSITLSYCV